VDHVRLNFHPKSFDSLRLPFVHAVAEMTYEVLNIKTTRHPSRQSRMQNSVQLTGFGMLEHLGLSVPPRKRCYRSR
jgi:hypothetical protein